MMPTMIFGDKFSQFAIRESVFLPKCATSTANWICFSFVLAFEQQKSEARLDSFRSRAGLETEPPASFRAHGSEVPSESGARNSEQASSLTLVTPCSLIDGPDMSLHSIG